MNSCLKRTEILQTMARTVDEVILTRYSFVFHNVLNLRACSQPLHARPLPARLYIKLPERS